jgi:hypothetical protein
VTLLQGKVLTQMEEITDIANNSIDGRDKIVAGRAVDALRDFLIDYIANKPRTERCLVPHRPRAARQPELRGHGPGAARELDQQHLWVEWKTLRQFLGVYDEALDSMEEINSLIAIDTRYIGEAAAEKGQPELVRMVFRFFNSYLRSAINHGSVRTAYNVLHQYRMLLQRVLRLDQSGLAGEGVAFLKYYGHIAFDEGLPFIIETVAYDIAALCEFAHRGGMAAEERILRQFLDLDMHGPGRSRRYERGLRGVRKAQAKLAVYYLSVGEEAKARLIADDMRDEPPELLRAIHAELAEVDSPHFWEIIDRGAISSTCRRRSGPSWRCFSAGSAPDVCPFGRTLTCHDFQWLALGGPQEVWPMGHAPARAAAAPHPPSGGPGDPNCRHFDS